MPGRHDRVRKAVEPVAAHEQDVPDPAVPEPGEHARPEPRSLGRAQPDAQHVLEPVRIDAGDQVGSLVVYRAAVPDLHHESVDVKNGVKGIQRPVLPSGDLVSDHVGHRRYQRGGNLGPVNLRQVRVNVPRSHPAGVKREDHVINGPDAPLSFRHDLRLELGLPVPRHRKPHRARRRRNRLPEGAVPGITGSVSRRVAFRITQMIVHFRAQRPLDNPGRSAARIRPPGPSSSETPASCASAIIRSIAASLTKAASLSAAASSAGSTISCRPSRAEPFQDR